MISRAPVGADGCSQVPWVASSGLTRPPFRRPQTPPPNHRGGRSRAHLCADRARALLGLPLLLAGRADQDRDLAEVLVLVEELMSLGDAVEAHHAPEHRLDLALGHQLVGSHALVGIGEVRANAYEC